MSMQVNTGKSILEETFFDAKPKVDATTTLDELKIVYDAWADTFDKDWESHGYKSYLVAIETFAKHVEKLGLPKTMRILDVAAGTGLVGKTLKSFSFTDIDAYDMSMEMLRVAEKKNIYTNFICARLGGGHKALVATDTYDGLTCLSTLSTGHIKCDALQEFVRIVKPDGLLCFTIKTTTIDSNEGNYAQTIEDLVTSGQLAVVSREESVYVAAQAANKTLANCYVYICRVLKSTNNANAKK